jgi:hypothetical protein
MLKATVSFARSPIPSCFLLYGIVNCRYGYWTHQFDAFPGMQSVVLLRLKSAHSHVSSSFVGHLPLEEQELLPVVRCLGKLR